MKKIITVALILLILLNVPCSVASVYTGLPEPDIRAAAALLANADDGEILYARNIDEIREPASLTKIMTVMLALEYGDLNDIVTVNQSAFSDIVAGSSNSGLVAGEEIVFKDLLYAIMLESANEGCNALAEHISGSIQNFVDMMNERAQELDCADTHFANPHGLPAAGHVTTASDILRMTLEAMENPLFMEIAHTDTYTLPATNKHTQSRKINTTNALISTSRYTEYLYQYAKGIKTGTTNAAGYCLVSAAEKDNLRLVTVVLGAVQEPETKLIRSFVETKLLFEWGFNNFTQKKLLGKTELIGEVTVIQGVGKEVVTYVPHKEIYALIPKTLDIADIERKVNLIHPEGIMAPVYKDEVLGTVTLEYEGHVYGTVNLLASYTVMRDEAQKLVTDIREKMDQPVIKRVLIILGISAVLYIIFAITLNIIKRRGKKQQSKKRYTYRGK